MPSEVVVAIISLGAPLIGATSAFFIERMKLRSAQKELSSKTDQLRLGEAQVQQTQKLLARLENAVLIAGGPSTLPPGIGYTMHSHRAVWTLNDDGSGTSTKEYLGLRASQTFQNFKLPFRAMTWGFDIAHSRPELTKIQPPWLAARLDASSLQMTNDLTTGQLIIDGPFGPETGLVDLILELRFGKAFALTAREAEHLYGRDEWPKDYVATSTIWQLEMFELIVHFPTRFHGRIGRPQPVAFLDGTETVHSLETHRLNDPGIFNYNEVRAQLTVPHPVRGIKYAISWLPPATE